MPFKILYSSEFVAELSKLEKEIAERVMKKIDDAAGNPRHFFKGLTARSEQKLRIGDYRVLARPDWKEETMAIISIGHRKNIYD